MWQLVREVLSTPVGSFAFILSFMILAGWLIHYITRFITKWTCNMEGSKSTVDKVESNIDSIRSDISYIKGMINILQANANPLTQSHSPIGLSEKGKKVAEEMGVASMIADNWEHISTYIQDNTKSKNAYDIQQFCIETASVSIEKFFNPEDVSKFKTFAFNAGHPIAYYGSMIGVLVRDKNFQEKNIAVEDVDKHDPTLQK